MIKVAKKFPQTKHGRPLALGQAGDHDVVQAEFPGGRGLALCRGRDGAAAHAPGLLVVAPVLEQQQPLAGVLSPRI